YARGLFKRERRRRSCDCRRSGRTRDERETDMVVDHWRRKFDEAKKRLPDQDPVLIDTHWSKFPVNPMETGWGQYAQLAQEEQLYVYAHAIDAAEQPGFKQVFCVLSRRPDLSPAELCAATGAQI